MLVKIAWLCLVSFGVVLLLNEPAELDIEVANLVATTTAFVGLVVLSAIAAIAVGGITGRRAWALGAGAGIAVYGYAMNALGNQGDDVEWLQDLSPYSWAYADVPLENGWGEQTWLVFAVAAVLLVIGWLVFRRRDIAV